MTDKNFKQRLIQAAVLETKEPTPAALALATSLTQREFEDVYYLANLIDGVAAEARINERRRIFRMGFFELIKEMWKAQKLYRPEPFA